jgi:hypothetical protein
MPLLNTTTDNEYTYLQHDDCCSEWCNDSRMLKDGLYSRYTRVWFADPKRLTI